MSGMQQMTACALTDAWQEQKEITHGMRRPFQGCRQWKNEKMTCPAHWTGCIGLRANDEGFTSSLGYGNASFWDGQVGRMEKSVFMALTMSIPMILEFPARCM